MQIIIKEIKTERRIIMGFIKGALIGITVGAMAGMVIGSTNCEYMQDLFRKSRREIRRFRRKYSM